MSQEETKSVAVSRQDLEKAVREGVITSAQSVELWRRWDVLPSVVGPSRSKEASDTLAVKSAVNPGKGPGFGFTNVLYYFGGMLAIGAMTLFMTLGWQAFGDWGLFAIAIGYLSGALLVANNLLERKLTTPAGILATLAVCLVPLVLWAMQSGLGFWPKGGASSYRAYHTNIDWRWVTLEFGTLAAGVVMLWRFRLPFMVMPIAVTLWYMSMDIASLIMQQEGYSYEFARDVTLVFGMATCFIALWVDARSRLAKGVWNQDFAFWLYIFGVLMFWGGLSLQNSGSQLGKAIYALINVAMVFFGAAIGRRVFTVFGALGVAGYLGNLSYGIFRDSLMFPFMLTFLGLGIIALGIWWQRHEAQIEAKLSAFLPEGIRPR